MVALQGGEAQLSASEGSRQQKWVFLETSGDKTTLLKKAFLRVLVQVTVDFLAFVNIFDPPVRWWTSRPRLRPASASIFVLADLGIAIQFFTNHHYTAVPVEYNHNISQTFRVAATDQLWPL